MRIKMDIAEKINYLRTKIVIQSQDQFAANIGVTRSTVKNWENGLSKPTVSHILMISMLCNVSVNYLIFDNCPEELSLIGLTDDQYLVIKTLINYYNSLNKKRGKL